MAKKKVSKQAEASVRPPKRGMALACLNHTATEIEALKANNGGRVPYGRLQQLVEENKPCFPWLSVDKVNNHLRKYNKECTITDTVLHNENVTTMGSIFSFSGLSSLTGDETSGDDSTYQQPDASKSDESTTASDSTGQSTLMVEARAGRPKGSTSANSSDLERRIRLAKQEAAERFSLARRRAKRCNKRTTRGTFAFIIVDCKAKHNIPEGMHISVETLRSRAKRGNFKGGNVGNTSPMEDVEPYIVELIGQLAKMRVPITRRQGLQLANLLISGTLTEERVRVWKEKHCAAFTTNGGQVTLGSGYWKGFMKRNGHIVKAKKGVKFDAKRADWCTYLNFETMYNNVYSEMVEGGIAERLDNPVWLNKEGQIVEHEEEAFGLPTRYRLLHPNKLLFVDEVGSNTSQAKDGNMGGEKFLVLNKERPLQRSACKDSHFTVLGFTTASGEAVMCAIVFAAQELDPGWVLGLDPFAPWVGEENDVKANSSKDKRHPLGPECELMGKRVPTFCCCSVNGSITSDLLTEMLRTIDEIGVYDRSDNIPPFLILDGHGSRFELPFIEYINGRTRDNKQWNVCIGVPYGTSYWQVGDSTEQNGCFKMSLTRAKNNLLAKKETARLPFAVEKSDIVPLVGTAWETSFARKETNIKAVADDESSCFSAGGIEGV